MSLSKIMLPVRKRVKSQTVYFAKTSWLCFLSEKKKKEQHPLKICHYFTWFISHLWGCGSSWTDAKTQWNLEKDSCPGPREKMCNFLGEYSLDNRVKSCHLWHIAVALDGESPGNMLVDQWTKQAIVSFSSCSCSKYGLCFKRLCLFTLLFTFLG